MSASISQKMQFMQRCFRKEPAEQLLLTESKEALRADLQRRIQQIRESSQLYRQSIETLIQMIATYSKQGVRGLEAFSEQLAEQVEKLKTNGQQLSRELTDIKIQQRQAQQQIHLLQQSEEELCYALKHPPRSQLGTFLNEMETRLARGPRE